MVNRTQVARGCWRTAPQSVAVEAEPLRHEFHHQRQAFAWVLAFLPLVLPIAAVIMNSWTAGLAASALTTAAVASGKRVLFPRAPSP